jgi:Flp pilus assembly protein TadD
MRKIFFVSFVATTLLVFPPANIAAESPPKQSGFIQKIIETALTELAKRVTNGSIDALRRQTCSDATFRTNVVVPALSQLVPRNLFGTNLDGVVLTTLDCASIAPQSSNQTTQANQSTSKTLEHTQQSLPEIEQSTPPDLIGWAIGLALENDSLGIDRVVARLDSFKKLEQAGNRVLAHTYNDIGLQNLKQAEYKEAEQNFVKAVESDPNDEESLNNLGYVRLLLRGHDEAGLIFLKTLTLAPRRAAAWMNLGSFFGEKGLEEPAVGAYLLAYRYSRKPEIALNTLRGCSPIPNPSVENLSACKEAVRRIVGN